MLNAWDYPLTVRSADVPLSDRFVVLVRSANGNHLVEFQRGLVDDRIGRGSRRLEQRTALYSGNWRTFTTLSPMNVTNTVFSGGVPKIQSSVSFPSSSRSRTLRSGRPMVASTIPRSMPRA